MKDYEVTVFPVTISLQWHR